jgi:hypothetical protein
MKHQFFLFLRGKSHSNPPVRLFSKNKININSSAMQARFGDSIAFFAAIAAKISLLAEYHIKIHKNIHLQTCLHSYFFAFCHG